MLKLDVLAAELNLWANETEQIYRATKESKYRGDAKHLRYLAATLNQSSLPSTGVTSFNTRVGDVVLSSLDVTTALGYNPVTQARTLTINGVTYDLSANRSWTISTAIPTLAQVTTAGNTTTNAITVGGLTSTGGINAGSNLIGRSDWNQGIINFGNTGEIRFVNGSGAGFFYTWYQNSGGGGIERMRLSTNNNLLIGTTTDAGYKLDVNGTARVSGVASLASIAGQTTIATGAVFNADTTVFTITGGRGNNQDGVLSINTSIASFTPNYGGVKNMLNIGGNFTVGSAATGDVNFLNINPTINYPVGSSGTQRGIYINPTLTRVTNYKAIEVAQGLIVTNASITAASALAQGVYFNNTLVAAANNDVLVGLDINPTFTNGAFTGVANYAARITGTVVINAPAFNITNSFYVGGSGGSRLNNIIIGGSYGSNTITDAGGTATLTLTSTGFGFHGAYDTITASAWVHIKNAVSGSPILRLDNTSGVQLFTVLNSGNVLIGTTTDAGYKLDVNGTARFVSAVTFNNSATNTIGGFVHSSSSPSNDAFYTLYLGSVRFYVRSDGYCRTTTSIVTDTNGVVSVDASAISQIDSTTKGFLQPRMTNAQALAITTSATGLQVYDTTNNKNLLYNGTAWQNIATETWVSGQGYLTSTPALDQVVTAGNSVSNNGITITRASGATLTLNPGPSDNAIVINNSGFIRFTGAGIDSFIRGNSTVFSVLGAGYVSKVQFHWGGSASYINTGGNFLIGTTTDAGYKLDVNGSARINNTTQFIFNTSNLQVATSGLSAFYFNNAINWSTSTFTLQRQGGGVGLHINASDNVGIGTTSPFGKVDVKDGEIFVTTSTNANLRSRLTYQGLYVSRASDGTYPEQITSISSAWEYHTRNNHVFYRDGTAVLAVGQVGPSAYMTINTTGNILIGTTTDAGYKLDVNGTGRFTNNLSITKSYNLTWGTNQQINVTDYPSYFSGGYNVMSFISTSSGSYADDGSFVWRNAGTSSNLMVLTGVGNLGLGTSNPTEKFQIIDSNAGNKFARIIAYNSSASGAWVAQNDQIDNIVYRIFGSTVGGTQFGQSLNRSASLMANLGGSGKFLIGSYSGTDLIFGTSDQARMRLVDSTGNFLIGTMTDSGHKLSVSGTAKIGSDLTLDAGLIIDSTDVTTAWTAYTPAWTSDGGTQPNLGNGTITGAYKKIGKTVFIRVKLNFGSTTTGGSGSWLFSLPVNAASSDGIQFPCSMLDNGFAWYQGTVNGTYSGFTNKTAIITQSAGGVNSSQSVTGVFPFTWGNADSLQFNGSYECI